MLKPQDILVLLKILAKGEQPWAQGTLAQELGMSASEVNAAIKRLQQAGLARMKQGRLTPIRTAVFEFLAHGIKYVFPAERGEPTRGLPTAYATSIFKDKLAIGGQSIPVWPCAEGHERGYTLKPLYKSVPFAAQKDQTLYDYLAIVDVLRSGNARDIKVAKELLQEALNGS